MLIHPAYIQDRDGATMVLKSLRYRFPLLRHIVADGGYAGDKLRRSLRGHGAWTTEIIKRSDTAKASRFCLDGGWSSAPSPSSAAAGVSPRTGSNQPKARDSMDPHRQHTHAHETHRKILDLLVNF